MPAGRPSTYKPEFVEQARKLCLIFSFTDEKIAQFFGVSLETIAMWARENEKFFNAITPNEDDVRQFKKDIFNRRAKINQARKSYLHANPNARIRNSMSARLWASLKGRTDGALFSRLGYSEQELMVHLEGRFEPGMTWKNYGKWHVDHVRPCALFDFFDDVQFAKCWALDNLQPLWAIDNIKKGARYAGT